MPEICYCPRCNRRLSLPDELVGEPVQCPGCGTTFTGREGPPPVRGTSAPPPPRQREAVPPREEEPRRPYYPLPRSRSTYEDEYEDEYDQAARGQPRREGLRSAALGIVAGPALGLQLVGGFGLVISILLLCIGLTGPGVFVGRPRGGEPPMNRDMVAEVVNAVIMGIVGICWSGIVLSGASKMKSLRNHGQAMTASIVALIPCNFCWLLGLPIGIWALVTLTRNDVKEAFR